MADQIAGKGSLSKNEKKDSDKHPGMTGSITFSDDIPAGTKLYLATWRNENENGVYLAVRASWPMERTGGGREQPAARNDGYRPRPAPSRARDLDDEIPF